MVHLYFLSSAPDLSRLRSHSAKIGFCVALMVVLLFVLNRFAGTAFGASAPVASGAKVPQQVSLFQLKDNQGRLITNTDLINVNVIVTDRDGKHVSGLDKSAFAVVDDELTQEISFFSAQDIPISIAVIFDTSQSMEAEKIVRAREALARFIELSHRSDEYFLISFSDRVQLLLDGSQDIETVLERFAYLKPQGQTSLYDATYLGIEKVARGSRARRAILLITDGNDTCSRYSLRDVSLALQESDVVVYAIGILGFSRVKALAGRRTLERLTSVSGGKAYFPGSSEALIGAFEQIALELRSQYFIAYRPIDLSSGRKWHRIKVELTSVDKARFKVRSRPGAYAPND
ncbi:MAG TPA: VWA domain-containing protein [Pyrinomonadaceae bacterium]